jgi:two-component system sensor histidine kinase MprB
VAVRTDLDAVAVEGVPDRLARALNNLLDNAVKHSPAGAPVEVTLRGGRLEVRDHGDGIPAADLDHVFDRFHRGANARDRHGSGLGLAIVRQVVEAHGGTVTARNAPDGGAVFTLSLPQAVPVPEPAAR